MKILTLATLALISFNTLAADTGLCDKDSPIDRQLLSTPDGEVEAVVCKQGEDVLVLTDTPVSKEHLIYGGVSIGMPWLGMGLTYSQLNNGRQNFHISATLEGSLGGNGVSIQYGKHPFGNSLFYGGTIREYYGLPGEKGYQIGPSIGLSGGSKRITGVVSINMLGEYNTRTERVALAPELSMGIRIRLFKK